jgi:4-hydroxy-tetrahydrodipicolinate reductase
MSATPQRVLLVGSDGRMGRFTLDLLESVGDLEVVGGVTRNEDLGACLRDLRPDSALDFTLAGRGAEHGLCMLEHGVRPLIGTSGVQVEEVARLDALARETKLGGLVVPNFCLGIVLQQRFALEAARHLSSIEIVEEHHAGKLDAPSGTAADTARRLERTRGADGPKIPIHSLRLQGLYSNQSVHLAGPGEVLTLSHRTYGLEAFGPGILAALRFLPRAEGVAVGLEHALDV